MVESLFGLNKLKRKKKEAFSDYPEGKEREEVIEFFKPGNIEFLIENNRSPDLICTTESTPKSDLRGETNKGPRTTYLCIIPPLTPNGHRITDVQEESAYFHFEFTNRHGETQTLVQSQALRLLKPEAKKLDSILKKVLLKRKREAKRLGEYRVTKQRRISALLKKGELDKIYQNGQQVMLVHGDNFIPNSIISGKNINGTGTGYFFVITPEAKWQTYEIVNKDDPGAIEFHFKDGDDVIEVLDQTSIFIVFEKESEKIRTLIAKTERKANKQKKRKR